MADNLVIVAIPDETDRVWKVSSEKVPHMTLLFLGDSAKVNNLDSIMQFVGYAAERSLKRFSLPVDHRGELGADQADVLFFKKSRYDFQAVREFRSLLLKDDNIRTAYDGATQFETPESVGQPGQAWIPHLTLGYPADPAKPMPDDWSPTFYDVQFNKIAVWTGNYEGPEFLLKDYWDDMDETLMDTPLSVAMSNLEHHGVKGMKWGVRQIEGGGGDAHIEINKKTGQARTSSATSAAIIVPALVAPPLVPLAFLHPRVRAEVKAARAVNKGVKADKKWQKEINKSKKAAKVHNTAADEINSKLDGFNSDKRWHNKDKSRIDFTKSENSHKLDEYNKAFESEIMNPAYSRAAIKVHGAKSPSGRYEFTIQDQATGLLKVKDLGIDVEGVRHAADDEVTVRFKIVRDDSGLIIRLIHEDDDDISIAQTIDLGAAWLAHYGVKGMRWGVRRPGAVTTQTHIDAGVFRRRTKIQAKGGESQDAHPDAVKAEVRKQILKKSGTAALSNQDLRELNTRLQLEAQVHQLTTKKGQRAVQKQLEEEGKQQLSRGVRTGVKKAGPSAFRKARRGAATAATIAALA